jgi:hypothetical protein
LRDAAKELRVKDLRSFMVDSSELSERVERQLAQDRAHAKKPRASRLVRRFRHRRGDEERRLEFDGRECHESKWVQGRRIVRHLHHYTSAAAARRGYARRIDELSSLGYSERPPRGDVSTCTTSAEGRSADGKWPRTFGRWRPRSAGPARPAVASGSKSHRPALGQRLPMRLRAWRRPSRTVPGESSM